MVSLRNIINRELLPVKSLALLLLLLTHSLMMHVTREEERADHFERQDIVVTSFT